MDEKFDLNREADHWTSYLLASIAEGDFRGGVVRMIQHYHAKETANPAVRNEEPAVIDDGPLTLSVAEAASMLGISRRHAYVLAREGELPVIRLGHKVIVLRKALVELLSKGWKAK